MAWGREKSETKGIRIKLSELLKHRQTQTHTHIQKANTHTWSSGCLCVWKALKIDSEKVQVSWLGQIGRRHTKYGKIRIQRAQINRHSCTKNGIFNYVVTAFVHVHIVEAVGLELSCHRKPSILLNIGHSHFTQFTPRRRTSILGPGTLGSNLTLIQNRRNICCCLRLVLWIPGDDKSWRRTLSTLPIAKLKCQTPNDTCPFSCQYRSTSLIHIQSPHPRTPIRQVRKWKIEITFFSHFTQMPCVQSANTSMLIYSHPPGYAGTSF